MNRHTAASLVLVAFLVRSAPFIAACETTKSMLNSSDQISRLVGKWNLSELKGEGLSKYLPAGGKIPSLNFSKDGSVSGTTGINQLTSSIDLEALARGEFKMKPGATTKMAGTPEAGLLEMDFLSALTDATGFKIDGDKLSLTKGAETLMKFVKGG